jgi:4-aminobutyrate aminotransferase-like enzyme/Ser/Thr protein kinase RdoA (MazF antagonist)
MSLLKHAPRLDLADAVRLAKDLYGLTGTAQPLPSERDQNFLLTCDTGRYVLKIANGTESRAFLEAQNAALAIVARSIRACPVVVPTLNGLEIAGIPPGLFARTVKWIDGVPLARVRPVSPSLLEAFGRMLGRVDSALASFDHPAVHRDFHWDLARAFHTTREWLPLVADEDWRGFLASEIDSIEHRQAARLSTLRRTIIHNDANDHNVLAGGGTDLFTRNQEIRGLIDFGDMVHSWTVAEPAVAIAYAVLDKPGALIIASHLLRGYQQTHPLDAEEVAAVFDLVKLRLCLSACVAAHQQRERPDDEYLAISQAPIRRTLPALSRIPVPFAEATFRRACGMPASPHAERVASWLSVRPAGDVKLVGDQPLSATTVRSLDFSIGSPLVSLDDSGRNLDKAAAMMAHDISETGASLAIGGYLEARALYSTAAFGGPMPGDERRTIHLGLDVFGPAGSVVRAPLAGVVQAWADNRMPLDYGPVIILKHHTAAGDEFFTLYGHLSRESLDGLCEGRPLAAGEAFAAIGTSDVNGGWVPHLHFQVITDLMGLGCHFQGVCRPSEADVRQIFCPDPNLILRLPGRLFQRSEPGARDTLARRRDRFGRNLRVGYREPIKILRGWMQYLFDETGQRFLDAYNNVPHVGHSHPAVARAVDAQMRVLNTNTRYLHDSLHELGDRLTATLPEPLRVCYFVNSGSEANELALRLARAHTRRKDVIVLDAAYHGNTTTLIDISPYKFNGPGGSGRPAWVHIAPLPDVFRGPYKQKDPRAATRYASHVSQILHALQRAGTPPAAFIAETCPSVGGQIMIPRGYFSEVYAGVRAAGGVCIADEVQTAYGRMGDAFYAFEFHDVVPDIVVLGKPIGNGHPLGAVVTTREMAKSFDNGMEFFSTFGGNTVSCAAGIAVLDVVQHGALQEHARRVGGHLASLLRSVAARHDVAADVRGSGLFLGVELVSDPVSLTPARAEAEYVVNRLRERRILIGTDGPFHNVLKIRPPMPFDLPDAELLASTLDEVLGELQTPA